MLDLGDGRHLFQQKARQDACARTGSRDVPDSRRHAMHRTSLLLSFAVILVTTVLGIAVQNTPERTTKAYPNFDLEVLVNGRPLTEYYARGRTYIEALQSAEYELRVRNNSADRIAVALSVDGLNTIDARHSSAWNASKWVIEPYQTITISGWQMSSERARRFYFTNERDSYGAKLGQTANLGVIAAVFFRERNRPVPITPPSITRDKMESAPSARGQSVQRQDDDYAATGIGRNVHHDVRWVDMDLESRSVGDVTIRYEYYSALLKLGVVPRSREPYPLQRREDSRGFSPEPKY